MRGVDVGAKIRRVTRETGVNIKISTVDNSSVLEAHDIITNKHYVQPVERDDWDRAIVELHRRIYIDHGLYVFEMQRGLCKLCDKKLTRWETDHIPGRARGRDDRVNVLQVVCNECHRRKHGERVR